METNRTPSPDLASTDAGLPSNVEGAVAPEPPGPSGGLPAPSDWCREIDGQLPEIVDPLIAPGLEDSIIETRGLRRDGWNPERKRQFLEELSETGIFAEACRRVAISARSAYNLRDRDPLFDAGCDAAMALARRRLADDLLARSLNGVIERVYQDGVVIAEKHKYDNRLSVAVLNRLDARLDRAEQRGERHLFAMRRWDEYLNALGENRREDGLAMIAPPPETRHPENASGHELHELHLDEEEEDGEDRHHVWEDEGVWMTDYPPPPGFDGVQHGSYGDYSYRRFLSDEELAVVEEDHSALRAEAQAQREAYFAPPLEEDAGGGDECGDGSGPIGDAPSPPSGAAGG